MVLFSEHRSIQSTNKLYFLGRYTWQRYIYSDSFNQSFFRVSNYEELQNCYMVTLTINEVMQYSLLVLSRTDITIHDMEWNIDSFQFFVRLSVGEQKKPMRSLCVVTKDLLSTAKTCIRH